MRSRTHHPVGLTLAPNTNPHIPIPGRRVFCANRINGHPLQLSSPIKLI